jgi:hypothetical protein
MLENNKQAVGFMSFGSLLTVNKKGCHFQSPCGCRVEESDKRATLARQRAHTRWVKDINLKKSQKNYSWVTR